MSFIIRGRDMKDGLRFAVLGLAINLLLLVPPLDSIADSDLTLHMFQHIGLFVGGIVVGYGLEIVIMAGLPRLHRSAHALWRILTGVMRFNSSTKGIFFAVFIPFSVFAYWHIPQNFDLAVQNGYVHIAEHFLFITAGTFVGLSVQAISRKWRVILLYLGFMNLGMMGSMWTVWRPPYFPIFSLAANLEMGTAVMLFGALGVVGTSSYLLRVMDII